MTDNKTKNAIAEQHGGGTAHYTATTLIDEIAELRAIITENVETMMAQAIKDRDHAAGLRAERDEYAAAIESLVCELPGGTVVAGVAKARMHGATILADRDELAQRVEELDHEMTRVHEDASEGMESRSVHELRNHLRRIVRRAEAQI